VSGRPPLQGTAAAGTPAIARATPCPAAAATVAAPVKRSRSAAWGLTWIGR